ncbi:hypothetical protein RHGRI_007081 [Rhododendron griersonianum]|uniref:Cytochrome P450 n=1 Tax=Rhododendron griersonianum TaxID=479676 RepID=A0AAV6KVJ1_9ERIC|nr:hypothetical protein RHGRI_007081 [Rhododendron griersonianum]
MESHTLLVFTFPAALILLLFIWTKAKTGGGSATKRPPGPTGWPLVGNMFDLGDMPHQTMYKLKAKYGPLLWLQLGSVNTMVVQSPKVAAELFKNHDVSFADRKVPDALTAFHFNESALSMNTFGAYWRVLRRICSMEFLVNKRMNETEDIRRKCTDNMVRWIEEEAAASRENGGPGEVQLNRLLFLMAFNLVGNLMLSRDLLDTKSMEGKEFFDCMNKILELAGTPNVADFLPFLRWLDPMKIKRTMVRDMTKTMKIASKFVKERIEEKQAGTQRMKKDFLDVLLEYEGDGKDGPDKFTVHDVNVVIMEMFLAGSETTSISIEWGFAELLRNPHCMKKVQEEIDRVVGLNRKVEESDMDRLPYLQAVVKETLRLHPAVPLLVPRNTMEDTEFMGHLIPKGTQVFVNAWAIGRDPEAWEDPLSFKPERFLDSNIEYKGQHFELIPFGSGRRICIGFPLAHRVLHLELATMAQTFDWELSGGVTPETMDMQERLGITLRKKVPVRAIPKRRIP